MVARLIAWSESAILSGFQGSDALPAPEIYFTEYVAAFSLLCTRTSIHLNPHL